MDNPGLFSDVVAGLGSILTAQSYSERDQNLALHQLQIIDCNNNGLALTGLQTRLNEGFLSRVQRNCTYVQSATGSLSSFAFE
jgi:hypothetical protein